MSGWCKSDSGVRQGCPLYPVLLIIIYEFIMSVAIVQVGEE